MAKAKKEYPLGTPQVHVSMCEKHDLMLIDMMCKECEEFICSECVKEDHDHHNLNTIATAATLTARGLGKFLRKIEEEDMENLDEKILKASQQIETKHGLEEENSELSKVKSNLEKKKRKILSV